MAYSRVVLIIFMSMVLLSSVSIATDHIVGDDRGHIVGDDRGWTVNFNYTQWAQDKVFRVGDNLVFNYDPSRHNVFKVNSTFFQNCTFPPQNEALSTGNDIIPLKTEGRKWYVCGIADHCSVRQMKLVIAVLPEVAPVPSSPAQFIESSIYGVIMASMVAIAVIFT